MVSCRSSLRRTGERRQSLAAPPQLRFDHGALGVEVVASLAVTPPFALGAVVCGHCRALMKLEAQRAQQRAVQAPQEGVPVGGSL